MSKIMTQSTYSRIKNSTGKPPFCMVCKEEIEVGQHFKSKDSHSPVRRFHIECWEKVICYFCGKRIDMDKKGGYACHHKNDNPDDERPENLANSHFGCHKDYHRKKWWNSLTDEEKSERQRLAGLAGKGKTGRKKGGTSWNKGLTKETDERVRKSAKKLSKTKSIPLSEQSEAQQKAFKKYQEAGRKAIADAKRN